MSIVLIFCLQFAKRDYRAQLSTLKTKSATIYDLTHDADLEFANATKNIQHIYCVVCVLTQVLLTLKCALLCVCAFHVCVFGGLTVIHLADDDRYGNLYIHTLQEHAMEN